MILDFLELFSFLSRSEQRVFIFCLKNCPFPRPHTGDLVRISRGTGLSRTTVFSALRKISKTKKLRSLVCYITSDVKELIAAEYPTFCCGGAFDGEVGGIECYQEADGMDLGRKEDLKNCENRLNLPQFSPQSKE